MVSNSSRQANAAKSALIKLLMREPGFVGAGIASPEPGRFELVVFVAEEKSAVLAKVPKRWQGYPVRVQVSGVPRRFKKEREV